METGYRLPPPEIVQILDQKPTPAAALSPDRARLLLVDYEPYPSIELLARPFLRLAGIRIDPRLSAMQRTLQYTGLSLLSIETGGQRAVTGIPEGSKIGFPSWSPDGTRFAFTLDTDNGVELWVGEAVTASCRRFPNLYVTDVLAGPMLWRSDSRRLWVTQIPPERGPAPSPGRIPAGPVIQETAGKSTRDATYQDLLQDAHDEDLFEYYGAAQLAVADAETDALTPLGAPSLYLSIRPSPMKSICSPRGSNVPFPIAFNTTILREP